MVEQHLFKSLKNSKWVIGSFVVGSIFLQKAYFQPALMNVEVYGTDGNGGRMLKIITNLSDEEIARLKFARRLMWHWKGSRKLEYARENITNAELADRGIEWKQEQYIEYEKRPPHDKYL